MSRDEATESFTAPDHAAEASPLPSRMTRAELAHLWRVSARTIERHELARIGPQPIRVGGRVLYRREDVLAWEQAQIDRTAG